MKVLIATNNVVTLSFTQSLLSEAGIDFLLLDQNMSVLEGSIGIIPRRLMVPEEDLESAQELLREAGLEEEIKEH